MIISNFVNEIGNKIKIKIQRNTDTATNYKTKEIIKFNDGVKITMIGPTSELGAEITLEELEAAVREHGSRDIQHVDLAMLEVDGNISVMSKDYRHKTLHKRKGRKVLSKIKAFAICSFKSSAMCDVSNRASVVRASMMYMGQASST